MRVLLVCCVLAALVTATSHKSPAELYGNGGHAQNSAIRLNRGAVLSCLMELGDINHDAVLSELELNSLLDRYVGPYEQAIGGLSTARMLARCAAPPALHAITWDELSAEPLCLSTAQMQSAATYVCARAMHKDFTFDEFLAPLDRINTAFAQGATIKTVISDAERLFGARVDAGRVALMSSNSTAKTQVDALIAAPPLAVIIALVIVGLSLVVACL